MTSPFRLGSFSGWIVAAVLVAVVVVVVGIGFIRGTDRRANTIVPQPSPPAWNQPRTGETSATGEEPHESGDESAGDGRVIEAEPADSSRMVSAGPSTMPSFSPAPMPAAVSAFPRDLVIVAPQGNVPLPVAFQSLPDDASLSADQRARLDMIQEQFLTTIGGPNQDPASPSYREIWRKAQREADAQFKASFGPTAYMRRFTAGLREQRAPGAAP